MGALTPARAVVPVLGPSPVGTGGDELQVAGFVNAMVERHPKTSSAAGGEMLGDFESGVRRRRWLRVSQAGRRPKRQGLRQPPPYGEGGKYKLIFSAKAQPITPIPFADAPQQGAMQCPRYTTFAQLQAAKKLSDLLGKSQAQDKSQFQKG